MIILASKGGAVGNRLWAFAHLAATATDHGVRVADPAFDEYATWFDGTRGDVLCRFPPVRTRLPGAASARARRAVYDGARIFCALLARSPVLPWPFALIRLDWEERLDLRSPEFRALHAKRPVVFLQGWFARDEDALRAHAGAVRQFLRPVDAVRTPVDVFLAGARKGVDVLVGVHVRQGDYAGFRGGRYFYEIDTYRAIVARTAALFPGRTVRFVVCSDQPRDSAELAGEGWDVILGPGRALEDLFAMAGCDFLVAPPSTYALWASFAGEVPLHLLETASTDFGLEDFSLMQTEFRNGEDVGVLVDPRRQARRVRPGAAASA